MALIVYDGLDHYASAGDMQTRFGALQYFNVNTVTLVSPGRGGYGKCVSFGGSFNGLGMGLSTTLQKLTFGFAVYLNSSAILTVSMLDQLTGGTVQCKWVLNSNTGTVEFIDASGAVIATALNAIGPSGWYFVELQTGIGPASGPTPGSAAMRINGQAVPSFPALTGINTQATSNASCSGILLNLSGTCQVDDVYFADGTTGPGTYANNGFLGDVRSATLFPIGNNSVEWVPLANTNWQEVCEVEMDYDASYNRTATAGAQDSFNFSALDVDVNEVLGLQVTLAIRKEDAGSRTVAPVLVIGGASYVGTPVSVDVSYLYITSIWPINPSTNASWTASDINSLAAGYVVVT